MPEPEDLTPEVAPEAVADESAAYQKEHSQQELLAALKPFKTPAK